MPASSSDPSGNLYYCKEERHPDRISSPNYNSIMKTIQNINFVDALQTWRMHEVNGEVRCIGIKYSVKMESKYFEWGKFIPTLEKHFPDVLEDILNCYHQTHNSEQGHGQSILAVTSELNSKFRHGHTGNIHMDHPAPDFQNQAPEVSLNIMAAFATICQRCHITTIMMVKSPIQLIIQWDSSRDVPHVPTVRSTGYPHNHCGCANRKELEHLTVTFLVIISISKYISPL